MTFAKRLVVGSVIVLLLAMSVLVWSAERSLRRDMEGDIARALENEAGLIREALPADSLAWGEAVHRLSQQNNHRITLIDSTGRVRADSDFPPAPFPPSRITPAAPKCRRRCGDTPARRRGGARQSVGTCSTWPSRAGRASCG